MKSKDLRIGNYIEVKCIAKEVGFDDFDVQECNLQNLISISNGNKDFLFKPIPLTEEWLLKFGFKKFCNEFYSNKIIGESKSEYRIIFRINNNISDCLIKEKVNDREHYNTVLPRFIREVHQLQNLYFALTGEELTIKTK